jgi:TRAP-type C4-dicarboxylate transport system substrate-binding protein
VPLNITDVLTSLQTGIINTVYTTPYACLSLQWFTRLKYMTAVPITHAMGAVVVSKARWDKLNPAQAATVRRIADEIFARLLTATRTENAEAAAVIGERQLTTVKVAERDVAGFEATSRQVWKDMTGVLYEKELLDKLTRALDAHRSR